MAYKPGSVRWLPTCKTIHLGLLLPTASCNQPERHFEKISGQSQSFLFDFAPSGVYHALSVTKKAVRSYRTLSPLPASAGGLLSVALSLKLPSLVVNQHCSSVVPGLSSPVFIKIQQRSSSHLTRPYLPQKYL